MISSHSSAKREELFFSSSSLTNVSWMTPTQRETLNLDSHAHLTQWISPMKLCALIPIVFLLIFTMHDAVEYGEFAPCTPGLSPTTTTYLCIVHVNSWEICLDPPLHVAHRLAIRVKTVHEHHRPKHRGNPLVFGHGRRVTHCVDKLLCCCRRQ